MINDVDDSRIRIVDPTAIILTDFSEDGERELSFIEFAGRTCYKSVSKMTADSHKDFVKNLIKRGHESVLEHLGISVLFCVDRGTTHDLVRHRHCAFSMESTRYCNYASDKFGNRLTFVRPCNLKVGSSEYELWVGQMIAAQDSYFTFIQDYKCIPDQARHLFPNSLKADLIITANYREWRNIFKARLTPGNHPQMRFVMRNLLNELKTKLPVIFDDIEAE